MVGRDSNSKLPHAEERRKGKKSRKGVALLAGITLFCAASYFLSDRLISKRMDKNQGSAGRSAVSISAQVTHATAMDVQGASKGSDPFPSVAPPILQENVSPAPKPEDPRPFLELNRIIPFGMSLELIGRVEPGSRLTVNEETVAVAADGSYKHFTNPFPASSRKVRLVVKATDLAGRTSVLTAVHNF
jgi:hypothetical protein